ncbi:uncharacterized protein J3R85_007960 [Psidium guajava]|nr:uncharacterized protein J3R85_007960 [Psidium guajava]
MENNFHQIEPSKSSNPLTTTMVAAQISHPWPSWLDLMVILLKEDHYDVEGNPFQTVELGSKNRITLEPHA